MEAFSLYDDIIWIYSFSGTYLLPYRIQLNSEYINNLPTHYTILYNFISEIRNLD